MDFKNLVVLEINNWFMHIFFRGSALGGIWCGRNYRGAKGYSIG